MLFSLGFSGDNLLITKRHLQRSLSSQSLGDLCKYWQLNQNNQETENTQMQNNAIQKVALINSKTQKTYAKRKDRMSQLKLPFTTFSQEWSGSILSTLEHARGETTEWPGCLMSPCGLTSLVMQYQITSSIAGVLVGLGAVFHCL